MTGTNSTLVAVGRIGSPFGVRGWLRIGSATEPREGILGYSPWQVSLAGERRALVVEEGRRHGDGVVAKLRGFDDRFAAATLTGAEIAVYREQLPEPDEDEYYWCDLLGMRVRTADGREVGTVARMMETGANDVLVVTGEREVLIPFLPGRVVTGVAREDGVITVEWDVDA